MMTMTAALHMLGVTMLVSCVGGLLWYVALTYGRRRRRHTALTPRKGKPPIYLTTLVTEYEIQNGALRIRKSKLVDATYETPAHLVRGGKRNHRARRGTDSTGVESRLDYTTHRAFPETGLP